jgi:hypothetical protein
MWLCYLTAFHRIIFPTHVSLKGFKSCQPLTTMVGRTTYPLKFRKFQERISPVFTTLRTASESCYVIFGVSITVASIRRDEVNLSKFIGDQVNKFSLRSTHSKNYIEKRRSCCPFHRSGFDRRMASHDHQPWHHQFLNSPISSFYLLKF